MSTELTAIMTRLPRPAKGAGPEVSMHHLATTSVSASDIIDDLGDAWNKNKQAAHFAPGEAAALLGRWQSEIDQDIFCAPGAAGMIKFEIEDMIAAARGGSTLWIVLE